MFYSETQKLFLCIMKKLYKKMNKNQEEQIPKRKDLNIYPHLRYNILNEEGNCKDPLTSETLYCFTCKKSTCPTCDINEHANHTLANKEKYLKFDKYFFKDINKEIEEKFDLEKEKNDFITEVESTIEALHKKLDEIKEKKINEVNSLYKKEKNNLNELKRNFKEVEEKVNNYYKHNEKFYSIGESNNDNENILFLINYELMNLVTIKNSKVVSVLNDTKTKLDQYKHELSIQSDIINKDIEGIVNQNVPYEQFEDYYWDIKQRVKAYENNIETVQNSIFDILKTTGSYDSLTQLVQLMDSKNKKGINYIFSQEFFTKPNSGLIEDKSPTKFEKKAINQAIRINPRNCASSKSIKTRSSSKNRYLSPSKTVNTVNMTPLNSSSSLKFGLKNQTATNSAKNLFSIFHIRDAKDITLDTTVKQNFFAYSVINIYNKFFSSSPRKSFDSQARVYEDYNKRVYNLKEAAKPIPGTNEILVYDPIMQSSSRKKVTLEKEKHGYSLFPQGSRHILINNRLYITGGVDSMGKPMSIVLLYELSSNTISRIDNMIKPHSYHSIEYLENYDCFIVIGGEKNNYCELFDLFTNKWSRLPNLNYPRSNVNLYFDQYTSDVYCLFGLTGSISDSKNFSDVIEVLELNDINSGWIKIDYYKPATIDLKQTFVYVAPFTKETLIINGGKDSRNPNKILALFLMNKNEIVKVTNDILEEMKIEENKIKSFSNGIINIKK